MRTKLLRFEQTDPDVSLIDKEIAKEVHKIESEGFIVFDVQHAVGRDAPEGAAGKRYAVTVLLLYDEPEEEESEE